LPSCSIPKPVSSRCRVQTASKHSACTLEPAADRPTDHRPIERRTATRQSPAQTDGTKSSRRGTRAKRRRRKTQPTAQRRLLGLTDCGRAAAAKEGREPSFGGDFDTSHSIPTFHDSPTLDIPARGQPAESLAFFDVLRQRSRPHWGIQAHPSSSLDQSIFQVASAFAVGPSIPRSLRYPARCVSVDSVRAH
jgi:hypothetical protein